MDRKLTDNFPSILLPFVNRTCKITLSFIFTLIQFLMGQNALVKYSLAFVLIYIIFEVIFYLYLNYYKPSDLKSLSLSPSPLIPSITINYIRQRGLLSGDLRWRYHLTSFNNIQYRNQTSLSKHFSQLRQTNKAATIKLKQIK